MYRNKIKPAFMYILYLALIKLIVLVTCSQWDSLLDSKKFGESCPYGQVLGPVHPYKGWAIHRMGKNSKFFIYNDTEHYNKIDGTYESAMESCSKWGLEPGQIKHHKDLQGISEYIRANMNNDLFYNPGHTSIWISGTDKGHEGKWTYLPEDEDDFYYQAFWGFGPMNYPTKSSVKSADNVQLVWTNDTLTKQPTLVMTDVERDNTFYRNKWALCQFIKTTDCYKISDEEKEFDEYQMLKEDYKTFGTLQNKQLYASYVQKRFEDAKDYCLADNKQMPTFKGLTRNNGKTLFYLIHQFLQDMGLPGAVTGFWIDGKEILSSIKKKSFNFVWVDDKIRNPKKDIVLKYNSSVREGSRPKKESYGECLVLGILFKDWKKLSLQYVPCDLPQWTICESVEDAVLNDTILTTTSTTTEYSIVKDLEYIISSFEPATSTTTELIATTAAIETTTETSEDVVEEWFNREQDQVITTFNSQPSKPINYTNFVCDPNNLVNETYDAIQIIRMGNSNSKFVLISRPPQKASYFSAIQQECKNWGLEIATIKNKNDLNTIEQFFHSFSNQNSEILNDSSTFWISTSEVDHKDSWPFSLDDTDKTLYFHRFWGFTNKNALNGSAIVLHWANDTFTKRRLLVMMDADQRNELYQSKWIICQYPDDSECYIDSDEEKNWKEAEANKNTLTRLETGENEFKLSVSNVQRSKKEACELCKNNGQTLIDLRLIQRPSQSESLFEIIQSYLVKNELVGATTGFWVGSNNLFNPLESGLEWDWVDNNLIDLITNSEANMRTRSCFALGIIHKDSKMFNLQRVSCDVPQWVLCSSVKELKKQFQAKLPSQGVSLSSLFDAMKNTSQLSMNNNKPLEFTTLEKTDTLPINETVSNIKPLGRGFFKKREPSNDENSTTETIPILDNFNSSSPEIFPRNFSRNIHHPNLTSTIEEILLPSADDVKSDAENSVSMEDSYEYEYINSFENSYEYQEIHSFEQSSEENSNFKNNNNNGESSSMESSYEEVFNLKNSYEDISVLDVSYEFDHTLNEETSTTSTLFNPYSSDELSISKPSNDTASSSEEEENLEETGSNSYEEKEESYELDSKFGTTTTESPLLTSTENISTTEFLSTTLETTSRPEMIISETTESTTEIENSETLTTESVSTAEYEIQETTSTTEISSTTNFSSVATTTEFPEITSKRSIIPHPNSLGLLKFFPPPKHNDEPSSSSEESVNSNEEDMPPTRFPPPRQKSVSSEEFVADSENEEDDFQFESSQENLLKHGILPPPKAIDKTFSEEKSISLEFSSESQIPTEESSEESG